MVITGFAVFYTFLNYLLSKSLKTIETQAYKGNGGAIQERASQTALTVSIIVEPAVVWIK